ARAAVPGASLARGDLTRLPLRSASVDLALCSLALDHAPALAAPIAELARVVRPGGPLVISDVHPLQSMLGGAPFFAAAEGSRACVAPHRHVHSESRDAFAAAGRGVRRCLEPRLGPGEVGLQHIATRFVPDAASAAYLGMPAALVWDLVRS